MAKYVTVETTQEDIKDWQEGRATFCPLFRALRRAGEDVDYVVPNTVRIDGKSFPATQKVTRFINRVDHDPIKPVKPEKFRIRVA